FGEVSGCRRTRRIRQFRQWSDAQAVASRRFPSPRPLPWGEGEPFSARNAIHTCRLSTAQCSLFPLPEGEGQGEGKATAARRHANVFALACDNCPVVHMASSHSSFQVSGFAGGR